MAFIVPLLIGAVFGFGFKVRVLIIATFLTVVLTIFEFLHEQDTLSTALVTMAAVIAIQMGYHGPWCYGRFCRTRQHGFRNW